MSRSCRRCGGVAASTDDGLPAGWSVDTEDGGLHFLCGACTRANVSSIEARLSSEWWDDR